MTPPILHSDGDPGDLRTRSLEALRTMGARFHPLMTEAELIARFRAALACLLPERAYLLRIRDRHLNQFALRLAQGLPAKPSEAIAPHESAGAAACMEGRAVRLHCDPASEVAPEGDSMIFPLQVALEHIGYFEIALTVDEMEAAASVEALAEYLALGLRTLQLTHQVDFQDNYIREVLNAANAIVLIVSPSGQLRFISRYAEQVSGYLKDEVIGRNLMRVFKFNRGDRDELIRLFTDALAGRPIANFEAGYIAKNDDVRYALFNSAGVRDRDGRLTDILITGVDITEAKQMERHILHAEKLASLGEMAAGVAHELNNPLTTIYTNIDLQLRFARQSSRDEAELARLQTVLDGAERIRQLSHNLLGYARPSDEAFRTVDINQLIEQALLFCKYDLKREGVIVIRELGQDLPAVNGNGSELQQVFVNLIINAVQAMGGAKGMLTLATHCDGKDVCAEVRDNGPGIDPVHLPRIFQPFFTTKSEGQGSGLGLSIVMRLLQKHNGRIAVESSRDRGTRFTLAFPRHYSQDP